MIFLNFQTFKSLSPFLLLTIGFLAISCGDDDMPGPDPEVCSTLSPGYMNDIKPIINATCAISGCHVTGFNNGDYTNYDGLKLKADNGTLQKIVVEDQNMPPSNSPGPTSLNDTEIQLIECWIADGAPNN